MSANGWVLSSRRQGGGAVWQMCCARSCIYRSGLGVPPPQRAVTVERRWRQQVPATGRPLPACAALPSVTELTPPPGVMSPIDEVPAEFTAYGTGLGGSCREL